MSGSDLAPFVAAVLRDEVVDEMKNEIDELRSTLTEYVDKSLLVQIMGMDGTPIHYEESFKNAERYDDDQIGDDISLYFANEGRGDDITTGGFPLSSLNEIVIRLGGVVVQRFNIDDLNMNFYDDTAYDEENRMEYIALQYNIGPRPNGSGPIVSVHGKIGPLPLGWGQRHTGGDDIALTDLLEEVADENNDLTPQTLIIEELTFRREDVAGIDSFVTKI